MNRLRFKRLYDDLTRRVEIEGKKNPSWLMGYLQGKGREKLTGLQCAALVDLLLVPLESNLSVEKPEVAAQAAPNRLTLAQR